ncbi:MAG TPA: RNA polymerase sigma factor [Thermoanaerobaculia bacterium]|jgi:RNA polymerase sigma-70 factor (ECF subfamily)|nr:RNA polymerase sigma factor [Thermoanaerobaculia bacterium]
MTWDEEEIRRLIAAIQEGKRREENAGRLFRIFYPRLFSRFRHLGWSPEDSEDLTQDSFLGVLRGIEGFRFASKSETWLLQIANHAYANFLRGRSAQKRGKQREESLESVLEKNPGRLGEGSLLPPRQLEGLIDRERLERVEASVAAMPEQMRTCFGLRYDHGYKYREIAVLMRISIQTVKAHLHQARERLKEELALDLGPEAEE